MRKAHLAGRFLHFPVRTGRQALRRRTPGRISPQSSLFLTLFLSGFCCGVLYIAFFGRAAAHETSLLGPYFFTKYQQLELDSEELFLYVWKERLSAFALLWLAGLTALAPAAVCVCLLLFGAALGITVTTTAMKMGLAGILLCAVSGLPQFLLYVPAGSRILRKIYAAGGGTPWQGTARTTRRRRPGGYLLLGLSGILLFFIGALLEAYINPLLLRAVLQRLGF